MHIVRGESFFKRIKKLFKFNYILKVCQNGTFLHSQGPFVQNFAKTELIKLSPKLQLVCTRATKQEERTTDRGRGQESKP